MKCSETGEHRALQKGVLMNMETGETVRKGNSLVTELLQVTSVGSWEGIT
jgi:hypothetical protein